MRPAARGRGKRLLYWFRTPPGVRVGRAAIDETAIRLIEQHNPDVQFDWTRILKTPALAEAAPRRDGRESRDKDQRGRRESRPAPRPRSGGASAPSPPREPWEAPGALPERRALERRAHDADAAPDEAAVQRLAGTPPAEDRRDTDADTDTDTDTHTHTHTDGENEALLQAAEEQSGPGLDLDEVRPEDSASAAGLRLGAEGLVRLRARYAEVMARIADAQVEETAREELKQRAERLNPDAWVTADEVTAALEQYETVFEGLRAIVGRHPQRRRRGRKQV